MSVWIVSYLLLWILVLMLIASNVLLFRHVGVLHLRFGPRGALAVEDGPAVGSPAPSFVGRDYSGRLHRVDASSSATALLFVSPNCDICHFLIPAIRAVSRDTSAVRLLVISAGDYEASSAFARQVSPVSVIANPSISKSYNVANPPLAIGIRPGGVIARKGVVNSLEHLDGFIAGLESETDHARGVERSRQLTESRR